MLVFKRGIRLSLWLLLLISSTAWAQDDPFGLSGYADGDGPPLILQDNTTYEFAFDVFNFSGGDVAIQKFDITLPSPDYILDEVTLSAPEALHPDRIWIVDYDADHYTVFWESICAGASNSANLGDIREGEILQFQFIATTDSNKAATDGFLWVLTGDDGETVATGLFEFAGDPSDDDDNNTTDEDEDDDDDSNGSCGC